MNKSKKLFARALYLVFALALVAGLTLAPAVADSPADTDVGFELVKVGTDTAEWVDIETESDTVPELAATLPTGGLGNHSVKLYKDNATGGSTCVQLIPPSGITVSDLEDLTNDWGFWYFFNPTDAGASGYGPQLELKFTSTTDDGWVDITLMPAQKPVGGDPPEYHEIIKVWHEVVVADDLITVGVYGEDPTSGELNQTIGAQTLTEALAYLDTQGGEDWSADDWELTRVQVQLWEKGVERTCYIDDVTIDGTTYELEPIFLDEEYYSVGDTVEVTVPNFKANTDPIRINPVAANYDINGLIADWTVTVKSTSDEFGTTVDLEETGADTGVFTASFTTVDTLPAAEDEVYVQDGNTITVTYAKEGDWGTGEEQQADLTLTASVDDTAPTITGLTPPDDNMIEETMPDISASYTDSPAGIDETSVEMFLDGEEVDADADGSGVTYTPEDDLAEGSHAVTVSVSDNAGNEATETWSFRVVSWLESDSVDCEPELDALDTVGVAVSITGDDASITVGRYASNPEPDADEPSNLIEDGFFDVQVTVCSEAEPFLATQVVIKFADANITAESTAHVFDDLQGMWLACSDQGYNPTDEFLWVKVREADTTPNISELSGTPFAISGVSEAKGDFDGDGDIDLIDFVYFAEAYGSESGDANYNAIGDFDDDGDIDLLDFVAFASVFGN